jgi:hypothetical protein
LTTKFTRCTVSSVASRSSLGEPLSTWTQSHRVNSWRQPAPRTLTRSLGSRTPAGNNGTHKILLRLVICPIYSVVKVRPRQLALATPPERIWVFSNPMFGVKATFFGP